MTEPLISDSKPSGWHTRLRRGSHTSSLLYARHACFADFTVTTWSSLSLAFIPPAPQQSHSLCICSYKTHLLKQPFTSSSHCDLYSYSMSPLSNLPHLRSHLSSVQTTETGSEVCDTAMLEILKHRSTAMVLLRKSGYWAENTGSVNMEFLSCKWLWERLLYAAVCRLLAQCDIKSDDGRRLESITL